jgi:hypothetical protein
MKIKIEVSDDTTTSTITKEFVCWTDVFPDFLNALRGAGFSIDEKVAVYMPGELAEEFGTGDSHILYDSDLVQGNSREDIAGAIFDFAGYLTTLKEPVTFGASKNATPMVEHIQTWAQKRGLELTEANVESWNSEKMVSITNTGLWVDREAMQDVVVNLQEEYQKIQKQLSEPKRVEVIPLGEGKELRWVADYKGWALFRGDALIRDLDRFEARFVEAALKAQANARLLISLSV